MSQVVKKPHVIQTQVLTKINEKLIDKKIDLFNKPIQVMIHVLLYNKQFLNDDLDYEDVHRHNELIQII